MTLRIPSFIKTEKQQFKKTLTLLLIMLFALLGGVTRAQKLGSVYKSQDKNLSVKRGTTIKKALEILKQDYSIGFLYKPRLLEGKKVQNDLVLPKNFDDALKIILKDHGLKYKRLNSQTYGIYKAEIQNPVSQPTQKTVTGKITNAKTGDVLPGVNIVLKGTTTGTTSDKKGQYSITVPSRTDTLIFSFVGYVNKTVPIQGRDKVNIKLKSQAIQGQEAVVTAFGETQQEEDVVGAVTSLDERELNNLREAPTANLTTSLSGRIPGLIAYQRSGEPGANNAEFFVRGVTSFGYESSPLIIIDGVRSNTRELARLNPNDIANFSVLKDATATSLYGSQAANGVIVIKTKTGKKGHLQTDIRIENTISSPTQVPEFADPVTYMKEANNTKLSRRPLAPLPYSKRKIDKTEAGANPYLYPAINWQDKLFKDYTLNQRFNLHISGGGKTATYYISGSLNNSNGLLKVPHLNNFNNNIDLKSYSLRSNINVDLTNSTRIAIKLGGNFDDYQGPMGGGAQFYRQAVHTNPVRFPATYPIDSAHAYVRHPLFGNYIKPGLSNSSLLTNPYANMVKGYRHYSRANINLQLKLHQDLSGLTKGLEVSGLANVKRYAYSANHRNYNPYFYQASALSPQGNDYTLELLNPDGGNNHLSYTSGDETVTSSLLMRASANYNRTFGEGHGVSAFLVLKGRNQTYDNKNTLQESLPHRNINLAGRLSYNYKRRYYAEVNFGYTGSERFAPDHRFGFFPSYGVKWNVSNENFWKPIKSTISNLAMRFTYGFSGNDQISANGHRFLYLSQVNFNSAGYTTGSKGGNHINGIKVNQYSNPDINYERSKKLNLGINIQFFNKLTLKTNLYEEFRSNILQDRINVTSAMGLNEKPQANYGATVNRGFSTRITYHEVFDENWSLFLRGNFTFARNEITQYAEKPFLDTPWKSHIGLQVGQRFGLYADRLFVDEAEVENSPKQNFGHYGAGDLKYRDINKDGQITNDDMVPMGFPVKPEINYGFGFSLYYKDIDFSAFFEGLARESFWIGHGTGNKGTAPFVGGDQLLQAYVNNHWTEDNRDITALYPHFSTQPNEGFNNNLPRSTWFMRNGSFLRVKEVQIGYSIPQNFVSKLSFLKLRVYVNGRNLYHFSKFKLWDPEMGGSGLGYPLQRSFNIGIHAKF